MQGIDAVLLASFESNCVDVNFQLLSGKPGHRIVGFRLLSFVASTLYACSDE